MEIRRLQKLGTTTLVVSLPRKWALERGLKPGDSVYVEQLDEGLFIRLAPRETRTLRAVVNGDAIERGEVLERIVTACYLQGYDEIVIESKTGLAAQKLDWILGTIERLPGLEVVRQDDYEVVMKVLIDSRRYTVVELLRRMQELIAWMIESSVDALIHNMSEKAAEVSRAEQKIDSYYFLALRQLLTTARERSLLKEVGLDSPLALTGLRVVLAAVEETADHALQVSREVVKLGQSRGREGRQLVEHLKELASEVSNVFGMSLNGYLVSDIKLLNQALDKVPELLDRINALESTVLESVRDVQKSLSYRLMLTNLVEILDNCRLIAQTGINRFVRESSDLIRIEQG
ncbi:MAG: phosphate uptake regulator PhoU [Nitrososphaerota archaeon]|nr:phosphate uptake regulator PhoU [Candidatus Calditenuis fumarioli]